MPRAVYCEGPVLLLALALAPVLQGRGTARGGGSRDLDLALEERAVGDRDHARPDRREHSRRSADLDLVRLQQAGIDFLARSPAGYTDLLQVVSDATQPEVAEPEIQALEAAGRLYPHAVRRLLTSTRDALPRHVPEGILAQPAYEWMLS